MQKLFLGLVNLCAEVEEVLSLPLESIAEHEVGILQCAASSVDAGLLASHGFNLGVGEGIDAIGGSLEGLCTLLRILTRQIVLIGVEAHVAHENLQAKRAQV